MMMADSALDRPTATGATLHDVAAAGADQSAAPQPAQPRRQVPPLSSRELFRSGNPVCIEHQGQHYWLRLTRGNKLILTK